MGVQSSMHRLFKQQEELQTGTIMESQDTRDDMEGNSFDNQFLMREFMNQLSNQLNPRNVDLEVEHVTAQLKESLIKNIFSQPMYFETTKICNLTASQPTHLTKTRSLSALAFKPIKHQYTSKDTASFPDHNESNLELIQLPIAQSVMIVGPQANSAIALHDDNFSVVSCNSEPSQHQLEDRMFEHSHSILIPASFALLNSQNQIHKEPNQ